MDCSTPNFVVFVTIAGDRVAIVIVRSLFNWRRIVSYVILIWATRISFSLVRARIQMTKCAAFRRLRSCQRTAISSDSQALAISICVVSRAVADNTGHYHAIRILSSLLLHSTATAFRPTAHHSTNYGSDTLQDVNMCRLQAEPVSQNGNVGLRNRVESSKADRTNPVFGPGPHLGYWNSVDSHTSW